jgi:hypothetical protein
MTKPTRSADAERRRAIAAAKRDQAIEQSRRSHEQAANARAEQIERGRQRREAHRDRRRANLARVRRQREVSLVDLVDRLLDGGVVVHGDITLAVADVDLVYVGLRALIASVEAVEPRLGSALPERDR